MSQPVKIVLFLAAVAAVGWVLWGNEGLVPFPSGKGVFG